VSLGSDTPGNGGLFPSPSPQTQQPPAPPQDGASHPLHATDLRFPTAAHRELDLASRQSTDCSAATERVRNALSPGYNHPLSRKEDFQDPHETRKSLSDYPPVTGAGGFDEPAAHGHLAAEEEIFVGLCWRWRNLPKPTIAQVQGKAIAGGLMLVWPCDLVVASEEAEFSDPVVAFGVNGHEFFVHAWEFGARKAKEILFAGSALSAHECRRLGMVNHVVPREELESFTLELAERIASRPAFGLKLAKMAVNQSLDAQGQWSAVQSAFSLHHLGHAQARLLHDGVPIDPSGAELIRRDARASREESDSSSESETRRGKASS
jgi:enoyl-CoA hydratase